MTASDAFFLSRRLICFAVILQSIEFLQIRKSFADAGVWSWEVLRKDYPRWLQAIFTPVFSYRGFLFLIIIQAVCAAILMVSPEIEFRNFLFGFVTLSSLLICWRWRGSYNGGSDFMTMVVLLALSVASIRPQWTSVALGYIAVQLGLSYFLPGLVKLTKKEWRRGQALTAFVNAPNYEVPDAVKKWMARPGAALAAAWGLILFECCFPIVAINLYFCEAYLAVALIFHLVTFYVFGLNRFVWAWIAAFPALLCWR